MTDWERDRDRLDLPLGGVEEARRPEPGLGGPSGWRDEEEQPSEERRGGPVEPEERRSSPRLAWIFLGVLGLGVLLALAVLVGYRLPRSEGTDRPEGEDQVVQVGPGQEVGEPVVPVRPAPESVERSVPARPEDQDRRLEPPPPQRIAPPPPSPKAAPAPEPRETSPPAPQPPPLPPGAQEPSLAPPPAGSPGQAIAPQPAPAPEPVPPPPPPPPPPPEVAADPASLDFGEVAVGAAVEAREVVFRNSGGSPARIEALTLAGADPAAFALADDRCRGVELAPGGRCAVGVLFRARQEGLQRARLELRSPDLPEPPRVALTGAGATGLLRVSPAELAFGEVRVGSSAERRLSVSNAGRAPVELRGFAAAGEAARALAVAGDGCPEGAPLAPGERCEVTVRFAPVEEGELEATLLIRHGGPGGVDEVSLRGTALPAPAPRITLSPGSLRFPGQGLGTRSAIATVTVANRGTARLTFGEPRIDGRDAADFQLIPGSCAGAGYLVPGSECTIGLRFVPSAPGSRHARLVLPHDAPGGRSAVALAGAGEG